MANFRAHNANAARGSGVFSRLKITIGRVRASLPPSPTGKYCSLDVLPRGVPNQVRDLQPAGVDLGRSPAVVRWARLGHPQQWKTARRFCVPGLYLVSKVGTNRMSPEMRK